MSRQDQDGVPESSGHAQGNDNRPAGQPALAIKIRSSMDTPVVPPSTTPGGSDGEGGSEPVPCGEAVRRGAGIHRSFIHRHPTSTQL